MSAAPPPYTTEANADGTVIVKLAQPITFAGQPLSRLTIPALRGKHMRLATWPFGLRPTMGQLFELAAQVIEPAGALDELDAWIARDVAGELILLLGKSRPTGEAPSPT
jgi:hypothetical protein